MRKLLYRLYETEPKVPYWWVKFLEEVVGNSDDIDAIMKLYGGRLELDGDKRWLVFDRECDYTWFVLRWS